MTSQDSAVAEGVREMGHIFRKHERGNKAADLTILTLPQAYPVQKGFLADRVKEGARIAGWKVGCTSAAIRRQFGLTQPISGKLMEPDIFDDGAQLPASDYVDCAVEPELVFRLGTDLDGEADEAAIIRAIAGVRAGIELHNYRFWYGKPTSQELIASNGSSERGTRLCAGELVIPGSAVELVRVVAGDKIEARFSTVGSCHAELI